MDNQQQWVDLIKKLPVMATGIIGLITAIVGFVHLLQGDYYLGITILGIVVVVAVLLLCIIVAFAKIPPVIKGGKGVYRFERYRPWAFTGIGLVFGLICAMLFFKQSRLFVTIAFIGTATPTATPTSTPTSTFTPTPTDTSTPTPTPTLTPSNTFTPTPTNTPTSTPTLTPTSTPTPTPTCPYQAGTDAETIVRLIQAEAQAVLNEDISIIRAIFAEDATISDVARDERWEDPVVRYAALFANTDFTEDVHFEIQPVGAGVTEDAAYFTSGSAGKFISVDNPSKTYEFHNERCSDHWTFGRNNAGCWVITDFTFNACHIPFPP